MAQFNSLLVTGNSRFINPINGNAKNGIYYVKGTQTAQTGSWTGSIPVPALYDGLTIMYYLPYAGSGNATLNLTLSDGTTTGAKNCYYNTGRLTTHYGAGQNVVMTYHPAGSISVNGTATSDDRWIVTADYDSDYILPYTWTAGGTAEKYISGGYLYIDLTKEWFMFNLIYANTCAGALKLNVNGTGAKPLYINGTVSSSTNYTMPRGTYLTYYDGTNYYIRTDGKITASITGDAATVGGHTVAKDVPSNAVFTDNNTTYTFANGTNGFTVTPSGGSAQTVTVTPSITNNVTGSGTSGYIAKFNGANTITNGPAFGSATNTFLRNDGSWASPAAGSDVNVTQTATSTSANYEVLFSATADNTTRTEGARKNNNLTFNPSTGNLQATQLNGVAIGSSPKFTDNNTTYSMTRDGANVKLTPSSGSAQSVGLSDLINGLGEGTSQAQGADYLVAQYAGGGTTTTSYHRRSVSNVVNATVVKAALGTGSGTTKYLREDGTWVQPPNTNTTYTFANGTNGFTVTPSGGSAQTVTVTPSITNNVTGSGTSGYLTKFNGGNTITNGPQLGSSTTTFLSNAGTWLTPDGRGNKIFTTTPTTPYKVGDLYIEDDNNIYVCTTARSSGSYNSDDWGGAVAAIDNDTMENYVDGVLANAFGTNGGNVLWRLDANGKPYEFLVTDTPGNLNGKIWRWDGNGLRFSSSGYSGSYITLINSNGRFAADYLTGTFNANNLTIQNFTAALISGGIFTRGNSNNNSGTIIVKDSSGVTIAEVDNAGFKFYGAGNEGSRPYFIFNNSVGFAGYNASGALTFQISTDEFHIKKLYADAQLTIGGYLKAVPVNNGTNKGISFVKAY